MLKRWHITWIDYTCSIRFLLIFLSSFTYSHLKVQLFLSFIIACLSFDDDLQNVTKVLYPFCILLFSELKMTVMIKSWVAPWTLWRRAMWLRSPLTPSTVWLVWPRTPKRSRKSMTSKDGTSRNHLPFALDKFRIFISKRLCVCMLDRKPMKRVGEYFCLLKNIQGATH